MSVYGFEKIADNDPVLKYSPLVMGIAKSLSFADEHGSIELTKSGFFKRSFVNWVAAEFNWPRYSREDLFRINKVLNEQDFPPLAQMHALLMYLKIARHFKGTFRLTKTGKALVGRPGEIFARVAEPYIFDIIHHVSVSDDDKTGAPWVIIANVLNIEAETGITLKRAAELFFPETQATKLYDPRQSNTYCGILRPLCWLGLLTEHPHADILKWHETVFIKTPLWRAALRLQTDDILEPMTLH